MTYEEYLARVISDGEVAARRDYSGSTPRGQARLAGALRGFEECRGKSMAQLVSLSEEAERDAQLARQSDEDADDYWRLRCRSAEIEWVLNCVAAVVVSQGEPTPRPGLPTVRGLMRAAAILLG